MLSDIAALGQSILPFKILSFTSVGVLPQSEQTLSMSNLASNQATLP